MPSSSLTVTCLVVKPMTLSATPMVTVMGAISSLNKPLASASLAFCWLLQELAKSHAGVPSVEELTCTLEELVPKIARYGTFNFLMSNGQALWAHASTKLYYVLRQHPFSEVHLKDDDLKVDLADLNGPEDRLAIVVTEPLTTNEDWVAM